MDRLYFQSMLKEKELVMAKRKSQIKDIQLGESVISLEYRPYPTREYGRHNLDLVQTSIESRNSFTSSKEHIKVSSVNKS